eukprot:403355475
MEAIKLSNKASILQSLLLLEISNLLLLIARYDDDWQEFEEFLDSFEKFNTQDRSLPRIIVLIRDANNYYKKKLANDNFQERIFERYKNQNQIQQQIQLEFLPEFKDKVQYLKENQLIVRKIADQLSQEDLEYLPKKPSLKQSILVSIERLNTYQDSLDYKPISYQEKKLLLFETLYPDQNSLNGLRKICNQINSILKKENEFLQEFYSLDIPRKKEILKKSRNISNLMSGISIGAGAGGFGTTAAAFTGMAVVPVIGWAVLAANIGAVVSNIVVDKFVISKEKEEVQREFEKMNNLMNHIKALNEVLQEVQKFEEISPQIRDIQRYIIHIIHINKDDFSYEEIKQQFKELIQEISNSIRHKNQKIQALCNSGNGVHGVEGQELNIATKISKDLTQSIAQAGERIGEKILSTTLKVRELSQYEGDLFQVVKTSRESARELLQYPISKGQVEKVGTDFYKLVGENPDKFQSLTAINADKLESIGIKAKVFEGIGFLVSAGCLVLESYAIWANESDYHKKLEYFDQFEEAMNGLEKEIPKMFQYLREFIN